VVGVSVRSLAATALLLVSAVAGGVVMSDTAAAAGDGVVTISTSLSTDQPTPGENFTLTTSLANAGDGTAEYVLKDVSVREGPEPDSDEYDQLGRNERLEPGDSVSRTANFSLDEAGDHRVYVHVRLLSSTQAHTVVHPVNLTVHENHPRVSVQTEETLPGSPTSMNVSLANGQSEAIRGVELTVEGDDARIKDNHRVASSIASGDQQTFEFTVTEGTEGRERVTARVVYTDANGTHRSFTRTLSTGFTAPENPGNVTLTGLQVTRDGEHLRISGTASNVGETSVESTVVSVRDGDGVEPGQSQAEYFVGSVAASDFTSFEVSARLTDNSSTVQIPLRVHYLVDGVTRTKTVTVAYDPTTADREHDPANRNGLPITLVGGVGAGAVVLVGAVAWRRYDGGR
jgi:hypothetical protein